MSIDALSDKEKATLRLLLRGHDAKSIARHLDLSVHTINERLRDARRKLAVSSSREAARLLLAHEGATPETVGDTPIGAAAAPAGPQGSASPVGDRPRARRPAALAGALAMSIALALAALIGAPQSAPAPDAPAVADTPGWNTAEVEAAARGWLELVDGARWEESWRATGAAFRSLNTVPAWTAASARARTPLGAVRTRVLDHVVDVPAPPSGYVLVRFRTSFANKADATETLTLAREDGAWRVTGIYLG